MPYISTIILTLLSCVSFAQSKATVCLKPTSDPKEIRSQIAYYRQQIAGNPKDELAYYNLGMCHYKLQIFKDAIANYDTLILLNPKYNGAYSNRGICKLFSKDKVGACEDFRLSVAIGQNPIVLDGLTISEYIKTKCNH